MGNYDDFEITFVIPKPDGPPEPIHVGFARKLEKIRLGWAKQLEALTADAPTEAKSGREKLGE